MLQRRPYLRKGLAELAGMMLVDEIARVAKPVRERTFLLAQEQQSASAALFVLRHIYANLGVEFAEVARGEQDRAVEPSAVLLQKPMDEECRDQTYLVLAAEDPGRVASGQVIEPGLDGRRVIFVDQHRFEDLAPLVLLHNRNIVLHIGGQCHLLWVVEVPRPGHRIHCADVHRDRFRPRILAQRVGDHKASNRASAPARHVDRMRQVERRVQHRHRVVDVVLPTIPADHPADDIERGAFLSLRSEAPVVRRRRLARMMSVASRPIVDHPVAILCAGAAGDGRVQLGA